MQKHKEMYGNIFVDQISSPDGHFSKKKFTFPEKVRRSAVSLALKQLERFNKLTFSCETALCQDMMFSEENKF